MIGYALCAQGSPPPTRGKVDCISAVRVPSGITPAHAGKSQPPYPRPAGREDHPRPRGEKPAPDARRSAHTGSPPPMRGKGSGLGWRMAGTRITPAHAGKSSTRARPRARSRDHPRPCGEKLSRAIYLITALGSPPPMRGKESVMRRRLAGGRITPAHAGKRVEITIGRDST